MPSAVVWDYSGQYHDVVTDGGRKPPPSIGSPTFVWHVGIWRKVSEVIDPSLPVDRFSEKAKRIGKAFEQHDEHNEKFFQEINGFVRRLQEIGRVLRKDTNENIDEFKFRKYERRYAAWLREQAGLKVAYPFKDYEPQSHAFTLWWLDSNEDGSPIKNARSDSPAYSAIRVRVQVVTHFDHVTLSFYIDAAKPHGHPQIYSRGDLPASDFGFRRTKIAEFLTKLRAISDTQIQSGQVERERIPEEGISSGDASALQEIADYFYDSIWRDFMWSFGISVQDKGGRILVDAAPQDEAESEGEIFLDHRGFVMAVEGLDTPSNLGKVTAANNLRHTFCEQTTADKGELAANGAFGSFARFDPVSNEPGVILKSYWPFVRRIVPWADYREMVGCGITEWRFLYVNSLAASGSFYDDDESASRKIEVAHLKDEQEGQSRNWSRRPVTYLVLTKGEPHREQLGRFIERINALATSRLFALKNLRTIKNASTHIKLLGRELDGVLEYWGEERSRIENKYLWKLAKIYDKELQEREDEEKKKKILDKRHSAIDIIEKIDWEKLISSLDDDFKVPSFWEAQKVPESKIQQIQDARIQELASLVKRVERRLVEIGSALDNIGNGGSGRLLFVINRSKIQMEEFERMWPSLEIGNIDGWVTYGQFVERSVLPTFDLIRATGERLVSLRQRLQSITAMIQTSALIIESEETRSNTAILRRISSNIYFVGIPLALTISAMLLKDVSKDDPLFWAKVAASVAAPLFFIGKYLAKKREEDKEKKAARAAARLDAHRQLVSFRKSHREEK